MQNDNRDIVKNCPSERELEELIIGDAGEGRKAELLTHLAHCFTCNEVFQNFSTFYRGARGKPLKTGALPGMPAPLPEPHSEKIIHLSPVPPEQSSEEEQSKAFLTLSCLASSDAGVKGAFLFSRESGEIYITLKSLNGYRLSHVPLRVGNIKKVYLTDSRGVALIGRQEPSLFMHASLSVYLPLLEITTNVGTDFVEEEQFNIEPTAGFPVMNVQVYVDEDYSLCIELTFSDEGISYPFTAVLVGRGESKMVRIIEGFAVDKKPHLGLPIQILVFPV